MKKLKITIETEGADEPYFVGKFDERNVKFTISRDITPRYEEGRFDAVGFWDAGLHLELSAHKVKNPPEMI